jgi:hypothetical protein
MKSRCNNLEAPNYSMYGGRGIRVCSEWDISIERFLADVGTRPSLKHSLDRIDRYGNYCPGNVRWATAKEQAKNKRVYAVSSGYSREQVAIVHLAHVFPNLPEDRLRALYEECRLIAEAP